MKTADGRGSGDRWLRDGATSLATGRTGARVLAQRVEVARRDSARWRGPTSGVSQSSSGVEMKLGSEDKVHPFAWWTTLVPLGEKCLKVPIAPQGLDATWDLMAFLERFRPHTTTMQEKDMAISTYLGYPSYEEGDIVTRLYLKEQYKDDFKEYRTIWLILGEGCWSSDQSVVRYAKAHSRTLAWAFGSIIFDCGQDLTLAPEQCPADWVYCWADPADPVVRHWRAVPAPQGIGGPASQVEYDPSGDAFPAHPCPRISVNQFANAGVTDSMWLHRSHLHTALLPCHAVQHRCLPALPSTVPPRACSVTSRTHSALLKC